MWAVIESLFPVSDPRKGGGRPRVHGNRRVLDAIFCVLRSGCQWRMIPHDLVPWRAACRWYRTRARDGTWDAVQIAAGRNPGPSAAMLDAQSVNSRDGGEALGFDAGKTTGRKRHLVAGTLGLS
jgi:transposase